MTLYALCDVSPEDKQERKENDVGKVIYSMIASLDGYIEDDTGRFDWAEPDEEVFNAVNDLMRPVGTYLYGRRMYEMLVGWESSASYEKATGSVLANQSPAVREFARIWQAADKIVYSRSLANVTSSRTELRNTFEIQEIDRLKSQSSRDITIGGPALAENAILADVVDEYDIFTIPVLVGGGKPVLPKNIHLSLELLDEYRYKSGVVRLRYRRRS